MPRGSPIRGGVRSGQNLSADPAPVHGHAAVRVVVASCRPDASRIVGRAWSGAGCCQRGSRRTEFTGAVRANALRPQTHRDPIVRRTAA